MATLKNKLFNGRLTPRKSHKDLTMYDIVVDFSMPPNNKGGSYTYQAGDIIEALSVPAKSIVVGVQVEVERRCTTSGAMVQVGYGSSPGHWGMYPITTAGGFDQGLDKIGGTPELFGFKYFSSADTIDVKVCGANISTGALRLKVFMLE